MLTGLGWLVSPLRTKPRAWQWDRLGTGVRPGGGEPGLWAGPGGGCVRAFRTGARVGRALDVLAAWVTSPVLASWGEGLACQVRLGKR